MSTRANLSSAKSLNTAEKIHYAPATCWLGQVLVAVTGKGICAIILADDRKLALQELKARFPGAQLILAEKELDLLIEEIKRLIASPNKPLKFELDIRGTVFQQRVWQALCDIPCGETRSYSELAKKIGAPKSVRAVASACAANAIAIAIPCHRVVRSNGELSGYRWGIERKRQLLEREKALGS